MKTSAWIGTVVAVALIALSATSHADGWHKHRHHRHRGHHDRYYYPPPPPRPVYHEHHHYYREDHASAPVVYRPYYGYGDGGYGGRYYRRGHSSLPIIFGGVLGGVLGHELSGGDPLLTTTGAIAGGVLGYELDH